MNNKIFESLYQERGQKYVLLDKFLEDKINRLIDKHAKNGFAVISACRSNLSPEENLQRTDDLKQDLKDLGWSYTISYGGGFKEKIADDGSESFDTDKPQFNEISFVVYNYNRLEDRDLLDDAIALCDKYDQDDIYYQEPNGKAYWYNKDGEKDAAFSCMTKNDDGQMYFTGFGGSKLSKKTRDIYTKKHQVKNAKAFDHRFSGIMEAIALPPNTRIEEIKRNKDGEVFISSYNVLTEKEAYNILNNKTNLIEGTTMENKTPFREANLRTFQRIVESEDDDYDMPFPIEELENILDAVYFCYTDIYTNTVGATVVALDTIEDDLGNRLDGVEVVISPHDDEYYIGAYLRGKRTTTETGDQFDEVTPEAINDVIYSFIDENEDLFND